MVTSEPMHARSHASGAALCGATGKYAWSLDPDAVTCPRCRATLLMLGEPLRPRREGPLVTPICLPAVDPRAPSAPAPRNAAPEREPAPARSSPRGERGGEKRRGAAPRKTPPRPKKRR